MQAQRLVFPAKRQCVIEQVEVQKPAAGEILVTCECSLVSPGTEMSFYEGHHTHLKDHVAPDAPKRWASYPFYPGYSLAGVVTEAGEKTTIKPGQRVVVHHNHASACCVEQGRATVVPDGLALEEAAFLELAAISLNGVRRAAVHMGDTVVVLGAGLIGLFAIAFARLDGASNIIVMDPDPTRRELAMQYGATHALDGRDATSDQIIKQITDGWGADIVIEASGHPSALLLGLTFTRQGGKVVLLGCQHGDVTFNFYEGIQSRSLIVIGAHVNSTPNMAQTSVIHQTKQRDFAMILQWMREKRLDVAGWITHHIVPAGAFEMYEAIANRSAPTLGVIIDWQ